MFSAAKLWSKSFWQKLFAEKCTLSKHLQEKGFLAEKKNILKIKIETLQIKLLFKFGGRFN